MATDNEVRLQKELQELVDKKLLTEEQALQLQKTINVEQEKTNEYYEKRLKKLNSEIETLKVLAKETGNYAELIRAIDEQAVTSAEQQFKADVEHLNNLRLIGASEEELNKAQEKAIQSAKKFNDEINKAKDNARALQQGNALAKLLGIDEANKNTLTYQLFNNPNKVFQGFNEQIQNAGGLASAISISILMKIQQATFTAFLAADKAFSSFAAATGATVQYNKVIADTARGNTALGISFEQAGRATTDLYNNLNTFSRLNKSTQEQLVVTTAKLERLGISGGDTAKSISSLSMMMGVSEKQAAKTVEKFAAMGQAIGVSSKQMVSDFVAVKDQLAVFGSTMDKTFTDLAAQAKATGIAVNDLLNLANKFDTFESAATQVSKLNAVLGGPYLSAMSMIEETDPTKRIDMLRQAVNNAGMSFESMSYYEKKAIAEAGGFKSVEEAQRILSMSAGEYAKQLQEQEGSQKTLNEAIQRSIPVQEKLQLIMANFAIVIEPMITGISWLLSLLAEFADSGIGKVTLAVIGLIAVGISLWKMFASLGAAIKTVGAVFTTTTPAVNKAGKSAGNALRSIGIGLRSLGQSITSVMPQLLVLSVVLLAIGAAVWMIGLGFKALFEGFAAVLEQAVKAPEVFLYLAAGVLALGAAMSALALNPLMWIGMTILLASLFGIAAAFALIDKDTLFNFRVTMEKIVDVSQPATIVGFEKFSEKFEAVAKATAEVEVSKMQSFANMFTATQNLSESLKLDQTVIVKIGDKKFDGYIVEIMDKHYGDVSTSRAGGAH